MDLFLWSGSRRRVGELVSGTPPRPPGPRIVQIECGSGDDLKVADEADDDSTEHDDDDNAEHDDDDNAELDNDNYAVLDDDVIMLNLATMKCLTLY